MRKSTRLAALAAIATALGAGSAWADGDGGDNSMSPNYGDSWASLQAQDPHAAPAPSMAAQENATDARAAWEHARENLREQTQRWRENMSNMFHRRTSETTTTR